MSSFLLEFSYLIGSVTFILGLKMLSSPDRARKGNLIAAAGMLLAIIGTVRTAESEDLRWVALDDVPQLPLHPALDAAWPELSRALARLT